VSPLPASAGAEAQGALPPIVLKVVVPCPPERAFDYFTRDLAHWWPLAEFSCAGADAVDVRFEPQVGGSIVESARDGTRHQWGTVREWAPGHRVAFTWHPGRDDREVTRVDVTFAATAQGTLVTLTHGGWDALGARGAKARTEYQNGWPRVFGQRFAEHCIQSPEGEAR